MVNPAEMPEEVEAIIIFDEIEEALSVLDVERLGRVHEFIESLMTEEEKEDLRE